MKMSDKAEMLSAQIVDLVVTADLSVAEVVDAMAKADCVIRRVRGSVWGEVEDQLFKNKFNFAYEKYQKAEGENRAKLAEYKAEREQMENYLKEKIKAGE